MKYSSKMSVIIIFLVGIVRKNTYKIQQIKFIASLFPSRLSMVSISILISTRYQFYLFLHYFANFQR